MSDFAINADHLLDLAGTVLSTSASEDDLIELNAILLADEGSRRSYLNYCLMHVALRVESRARRAVQKAHRQINVESGVSVPSEFDVAKDTPSSPVAPIFFSTAYHGTIGFFSKELPFSLLIATVLTSLGLWFASMIYVSSPEKIAQDSSSLPSKVASDPTMEVVGKVTGMDDCIWVDPNTETFNGDNVLLGRKYALASGLMEITYDTGAKVILQGPVTYEVESAASGFLSIGKLTARLEKKRAEVRGQVAEKVANAANLPSPANGREAGVKGGQRQDTNSDRSQSQSALPLTFSQGERGPDAGSRSPASQFTIKTPTATVTDLGTEFGVEVDREGATHTIVFVGEVLAAPANQGEATELPIRLAAGDAISIDRARHVRKVRCFKASDSQFVRSMTVLPGASQPGAKGFSFSETFQIAGIQAKTNNTPLANYPHWTFTKDAGDTASFVTVDPAGTLILSHPNKFLSNPKVTITAKAICGQSQFDVSRRPLTLSVKMGAHGSLPGWFDARLWVGQMMVELFPEYGAFRMWDGHGNTLFEENYSLPQHIMCAAVLTIVEDGNRYKIGIARSDNLGVSVCNTVWALKENVGVLDHITLGGENGCPNSAAYFSQFSVTQGPE